MYERNAAAVKLCECGCGNAAPLAKKTDARAGVVKGQSRRFLVGHARRGVRCECKYTCIGISGQPCDTAVSRPGVRCAKCSHKHYLATNRERDRPRNEARSAAHYQANRDEYRDRVRLWKLANPERATQNNQRWYSQHRDKVLEAAARWNREHPEAGRAACSRRRDRARIAMTNFDRELSVAYRMAIARDPCFYCGSPGEEDDHYQALAAGGTDHWWNLVRACVPCNRRKFVMHGDEFRKMVRQCGPR